MHCPPEQDNIFHTLLEPARQQFLRSVQQFINNHEQVILDSHWGVRGIGYLINGVGFYAGFVGNFDWQLGAGLALFNAVGMAYTWGTTAYFYGAGSDTDVRRFVRFGFNSAERIWQNPNQGIDAVKQEILGEAESRRGLIGSGLRFALRSYEQVRRLPHVPFVLSQTRTLVEKNVEGIKYCYDTVSPFFPTDYYVSLPASEYGNIGRFGDLISGWTPDNRRYRRLHVR